MAIFVDYENLSFVLQKREFCRLNHQQLGEDLRKYSLQFGALMQAVMWAEWDRYLPNKRQEQSAQAILTGLGFDCLYLLRPSDRSYTEQAIIKKLPNGGQNLDHVVLVSGDYLFPELLSWLKIPCTLITLYPEQHTSLPEQVEHLSLFDVVERENTIKPLQTPHGLEPAAFYVWVQRTLQEELRRRNWQGMSFHMLARLLVERNLCEEDIEAQFYINQAVRENFLERTETDLPTGRRVLLKPTIVEKSSESSWVQDEEFRQTQLLWALQLILSRNPWWEYVTFSRLREELEKWSLVQGANELQQAVEHAVEEGLYDLSVEEGGPPLFRKKYKYTFGYRSSDTEKLTQVPILILQSLQHLLSENSHWHGVSFSKLLDELAEHAKGDNTEELASLWLDRQRLKDWCNFLVAIGFLHAFRGRSRMVEGEFREPPTLLRAVPEHPWIQWIQKKQGVSENQEQASTNEQTSSEPPPERTFTLRDLDFYRLIVVVEHYLHISNNDAVVAGWMPMSTLFHVMGRSLERAFCNAIVRAAREQEIIEIRTHDPRPGQHPARGAHLDLDHPLVTEARKRLLRCLEVLQEVQDRDSVANLQALEDKLRSDPFFGETEEERLGWIELMREENLILVRPLTILDGNENASTQNQCSLNFRDRYVLALLETLSPEGPPLLTSSPNPSPSYSNEKNTPLPIKEEFN